MKSHYDKCTSCAVVTLVLTFVLQMLAIGVIVTAPAILQRVFG